MCGNFFPSLMRHFPRELNMPLKIYLERLFHPQFSRGRILWTRWKKREKLVGVKSPRSNSVMTILNYSFVQVDGEFYTWQSGHKLFIFDRHRVLSPIGSCRESYTMLPLYAEWTGWAVITRNIVLLQNCCSAIRPRKSRKDMIRWNGRYRFDLASTRCSFDMLHLVNLCKPQNRLVRLPLMPGERNRIQMNQKLDDDTKFRKVDSGRYKICRLNET